MDYYRIILRVDTKENWETNNPQLANGEVALIQDSNPCEFKVGSSTEANFNDLPLQVVRSTINGIFRGKAAPSTDPGTVTDKVYYYADVTGVYTGFGNIGIADGEVAFLIADGTSGAVSYEKQTLNLVTANKLNKVNELINNFNTSAIIACLQNPKESSVLVIDKNVVKVSSDTSIVTIGNVVEALPKDTTSEDVLNFIKDQYESKDGVYFITCNEQKILIRDLEDRRKFSGEIVLGTVLVDQTTIVDEFFTTTVTGSFIEK